MYNVEYLLSLLLYDLLHWTNSKEVIHKWTATSINQVNVSFKTSALWNMPLATDYRYVDQSSCTKGSLVLCSCLVFIWQNKF